MHEEEEDEEHEEETKDISGKEACPSDTQEKGKGKGKGKEEECMFPVHVSLSHGHYYPPATTAEEEGEQESKEDGGNWRDMEVKHRQTMEKAALLAKELRKSLTLSRSSFDRIPRAEKRSQAAGSVESCDDVEGEQEAKMASLLQYLKDVEAFCEGATASISASILPSGSVSSVPVTQLDHDDNDSVRQRLMRDPTASKVVEMTLLLEDKTDEIMGLTSQLYHEQEERQREVREHAEELHRVVSEKDREHEEVVNRHQTFIDDLLRDKRALADQCEHLAGEMKLMEGKYRQKVETMVESNKIEMRKAKDGWIATERLKREEWMKQRTEEIKKMTVKGLQPEIERILSEHKRTLTAKSDEHAQQLKLLRQELEAERDVLVARVKEEASREKEDALQNEKQLQSVRAREMTSYYEGELASLRLRIRQEFERDREDSERGRRLEKEKWEATLRDFRQKEEQIAKDIRARAQEEREEQERRFSLERQEWTEKEKIERSSWMQTVTKRLQDELRSKEEAMQKRLSEQHEKEREFVLVKLEDERLHFQRDCKGEFEKRLFACKEDHARELREIRRAEKEWIDKYTELREEMFGLKTVLADVTRERDAVVKVCDDLQSRIGGEESKWHEKIKSIEAESALQLQRLQQQLTEAESALIETQRYSEKVEQKEVDNAEHSRKLMGQLKDKHAMELSQLEVRIKSTIDKKDDVIAKLREQVQSLELEHLQYKALLERKQRPVPGKKPDP